MRVALIAPGSPLDVKTWSGVPFHMLAELRRRFGQVDIVDTPRLDRILAKAGRLASVGLMPAREPLVSMIFTRILTERLTRLDPDVVVVAAAEHKVAALPPRWPMVIVSDSFFGNIIDYYPKYRRLSRRTIGIGDRQQRALLDGGATIMLSSDWAVRTAAAYYDEPVSRFAMVPFGANFAREPEPRPAARPAGPLKLLFVGYDWKRKGGPIVLDAFRRLRGLPAELHIVGCRPEETEGEAGVVHHGVLDKRRADDAATLDGLFRSASLFFMPSRQEACAVAFAEACAFGLPCIAADTGGVGTIVSHGVNGLMLPLEADGAAFALAIEALWADEGAYLAMRRAARAAYDSHLNWRAWGEAAEPILREAAQGRRHGRAAAVGDGAPAAPATSDRVRAASLSG